MQAIRTAAKPFILVVTVTFLAWMVLELSGLAGSGGGIFSQTSVGSINGQSVDIRAYQEAVQSAITQQQQQTGRSLGLEETKRVQDAVWEQFVQTAVLNDEFKRRGLTVTTEEVSEAILYNPPPQLTGESAFQTEGKFDMTKYQRWLGTPAAGQILGYLEAEYRDRILQGKLFRTVVADVFLSDAALWERYRYDNEQVKVSMTAIITRNAVPDSGISVSSEETESYYQQHKTELSRPRTAYLSYVSIPHTLDASDSAAALTRANAVRAEIIAGAPFAEVAKRESADRGSSDKGGELGTLTKAQLPEEFYKAAQAIPLKTLSDPIKTPAGYHLIEVSKRSGDSVTARQIFIPIELAGSHRDLVDAQADTLERRAADQLDPTVLDSVARDMHRPIGQAAPTTEGAAVTVGSLLLPDAGVWAFKAKVGETSPLIDGGDGYYVFRVDSLHAEGIPALADVRTAVEQLVRESKKEDRAKALGEELIRRVESGASLPDASKALNLPNKEFGPFGRKNPPVPDPKLIGATFGLGKGERSSVITTREGRYVFQVIDHIKPDSAAFSTGIEQYRATTINTLRQEKVREFQKELRSVAKIRDDRATTIYATTAAQANAKAGVP